MSFYQEKHSDLKKICNKLFFHKNEQEKRNHLSLDQSKTSKTEIITEKF